MKYEYYFTCGGIQFAERVEEELARLLRGVEAITFRHQTDTFIFLSGLIECEGSICDHSRNYTDPLEFYDGVIRNGGGLITFGPHRLCVGESNEICECIPLEGLTAQKLMQHIDAVRTERAG